MKVSTVNTKEINRWRLLICYNNLFIQGQEEIVREIVGKNSEVLNTKIDGDLPIHIAARYSAFWNSSWKKVKFRIKLSFKKHFFVFRERKHGEVFSWLETRSN